MTPRELSQYIKAEAKRLGFAVCGIARATPLPESEAKRLAGWVAEGKYGEMNYLARNCDKREDPTKLVEGCKSIISVALDYSQGPFDESNLHLSRYAQGVDYHHAVKERLFKLLQSINSVVPVQGRAFCDTAPVAERYWAVQAGLGWIGRNHQLIIPKAGSYFFLGELMVDCEAEYDRPFTENRCGSCTRCIENCPTKALTADGFDARKCLSYLTIEYRGELPENIGKKMKNCFYGCDCCQTACPWNNNPQKTKITEFLPNEELAEMNNEAWFSLTEEGYKKLFGNSAVERAGYKQLMRNILAIKKG
ncbi:MAG: tRNA epoxyqueuosine(34) reductase QueG [Bacteroidaceae bacterium]|nr:tRNA epoxyqueuosine(34) reductase QueG [Bacteroidaceae bacterium]